MNYTFIIAATGRSGHHAFAEWLCKQFNGNITLHNHCDVGWDRKKFISRNIKKNLTFKNKGRLSGNVYCMEFLDLNDVNKYDFKSFKQITNANKTHFIIFNRDHYNWMASMFKCGSIDRATTELTEQRIQIWIKYVKESLKLSNILPFDSINVNYNKWFTDIDYRKNIANSYFNDCLTFTDKGKNNVTYNGDGSSFDNLKYQNKASKMDVLNRYKNYLNDNKYIDIVHRKELVELTKKYFDFYI